MNTIPGYQSQITVTGLAEYVTGHGASINL